MPLKLIYIVKMVQYLFSFPGWPAAFWIRLTSIILFFIPAYIPTHLNVEADYLITGKVSSRLTPSSSHSVGSISTLRSIGGTSIGILTHQSMSVFLQHNIVLILLWYVLIISNFFFRILLLFLFWHLVLRQIDQVLFLLIFVLNLNLILIFAHSLT